MLANSRNHQTKTYDEKTHTTDTIKFIPTIKDWEGFYSNWFKRLVSAHWKSGRVETVEDAVQDAFLKKVLRDARAEKADKIVCLGDVVGYGPDPVNAVALCRESCDVTLMGNHDAAVAGVIMTDDFIPLVSDGVRRHRELLRADEKSWLDGLPYVKMHPGFACAHGSIERPEQFEYIMDARSVVMAIMQLVDLKRRVLFVGHTHHACVFDYDSDANRFKVLPLDEFTVKPRHRYIVNVGSVGYPLNDHHTASRRSSRQ